MHNFFCHSKFTRAGIKARTSPATTFKDFKFLPKMLLPFIFVFIISTFMYFIFSSKVKESYWQKYSVPQVLHATLLDTIKVFLGRKTFADIDQICYNEIGDSKFCGFVNVGQPVLLLKDLEMIKRILVKYFDNFVDRRTFASAEQPSIAKMLVNLGGEEWKGVRHCLSPTFSSGKIRKMMEYFNNTSKEWTDHLMENIRKNGENSVEIDVEEEATIYTVEVLASAVFGMNAGAIKNPDAVFAKLAQKVATVDVWANFRIVMAVFFPKLMKFFGINVINVEARKFFETIMKQGMKRRMEGKEKRNDFLQLIAEARTGNLKADVSDELNAFEKAAVLKDKNLEKKNWLNDEEVAMAQLLQFLFAGFSTTSHFIGFVIYCLALNSECQRKLREEVDKELFKDDREDLDYDVLNQLEYLHMCACETLRKFNVISRIERICSENFYDTELNVKIPKGTVIAIPVQGIHNDPKFYKYPDKFYPEHFSAEEKATRHPYAYLPFGIGPRNCIGRRFALVKSKAAIAYLVHKFEIHPTSATPYPYEVTNVGIGVQLPKNLKVRLSPVHK